MTYFLFLYILVKYLYVTDLFLLSRIHRLTSPSHDLTNALTAGRSRLVALPSRCSAISSAISTTGRRTAAPDAQQPLNRPLGRASRRSWVQHTRPAPLATRTENDTVSDWLATIVRVFSSQREEDGDVKVWPMPFRVDLRSQKRTVLSHLNGLLVPAFGSQLLLKLLPPLLLSTLASEVLPD